jgi:DNA-binding LytR/AlgR family response regulator
MEEMSTSIKPIVLKTATGFVYFDYYDIIMCSADGNNSNIFSTENVVPIKILHNLSFIERNYCNDIFLRCHKSHIINLIHLEKLITKSHQVQLKRNFIVPLSNSSWRKIIDMSILNIH